jgi:hypothetical protein
MSRLRIAPIVEGHGEVAAVPILLRRVWLDVGGEHLHVLKPLRRPRTKLVRPDDLGLAVELAARKLAEDSSPQGRDLILLLLDANGSPVCELAPQLLAWMKERRRDQDSSCILAQIEFETWFVAAAESLPDYLSFDEAAVEAEAGRWGKGWVRKRLRKPSYSETVDQPAMTAAMDIQLCRRRSPSFDKLCRELEKRLGTSSPATPVTC